LRGVIVRPLPTRIGSGPGVAQNCSYLTIPNEVAEIFRLVPPSVRR
jgi:hypothetical protein